VAAGEAVSLTQGWCEGALETAARAAKELSMPEPIVSRLVPAAHPPEEYVLYRDWIIDVASWKEAHPGSAGAIESFMYKDIAPVFDRVCHSEEARMILACHRWGILCAGAGALLIPGVAPGHLPEDRK